MKKSIHGPRYIAIEILCNWKDNRLPIDKVMEKCFPGMVLDDSRDRQLSMSIVYGVIRWQGYLDWLITEFSKHPLSKMKSRTKQGLRVGIFQLLFLDRIPPSAAINETVQALKDLKQPKWLTGFVNGVLRSIDRQRQSLPTPFNNMPLPESALLSHPEWLIKRWQNRYGETKTKAICHANNTIAPLCLRTNSTLTTTDILLNKLKEAGLSPEPGKHSPLAIKLMDFHGPVINIPGFAEGLFQVQDEAAQLISMLFGPTQEKKSYLDGCAGLGGKTSHLAQILPEGSELFAVEPNKDRIKKLHENLAHLQLSTSVTIVQDTVESLLPDMKEKFDRVLIDAPCSGLGVIRRHPDIRWNRTSGDLIRYQKIQSAMLESAAQLLAPAGMLVYATCSTEPEENDEVIQKFLAKHPRFSLSNCRDVLSGNSSALVDSRGFFRTLPGQDDLDGFFGARLIKSSDY